MPKSKSRITVSGIECNIISDENESYVRSIAAEVDEAVRRVASLNSLPKSIIHVLVMLDFCDKLRKANNSLENLNVTVKECLAAAAKSQVLAEKLREDNELLKEELLKLKKSKNKIST